MHGGSARSMSYNSYHVHIIQTCIHQTLNMDSLWHRVAFFIVSAQQLQNVLDLMNVQLPLITATSSHFMNYYTYSPFFIMFNELTNIRMLIYSHVKTYFVVMLPRVYKPWL